MTNSTPVGRGGFRVRRAFLRVTTILCSGLVPAIVAVPAFAQVAPPPVRQAIDGNGVDLFLGTMNVNGPTMSAGAAGQGIVYYRLIRGSGWLDNVLAAASGSGSTITVTFNGYSDSFTQSGSTYTSTEANGAKLVFSGHIYTYTARDGTIVNFDTYQQGSAFGQSQLGAATSISRANGETLTLNNVQKQVCYYWIQSNNACSPGAVGYVYRLTSATSSNGYKLSFTYANDYPHSSADMPAFYTLTTTALSNSLSNVTLNTQNYSSSSGGLTIASTRVVSYASGANGITAITRANGPSPDVSVAYLNGKVSTVTNATGATTYSFSDSGNVRTTVVTDPLGHATTYLFDIGLQRMTKKTLPAPISTSTTWAYDTNGRVTSVTAQDLNATSYTYDSNGNITQTQVTPKPSVGGPTLTTTAYYPCSSPATCGSPQWTKDARNNQTDYTYDNTTGNLLTVKAPAAPSGDRPSTSFSYTPVNGAQILTGTSTCATSSTCVGTASETKTGITYNANGLPITSTVQSGDGSIVSTVTKTYDDAGNVTSVDGPVPGAADTITYRYDADREVVGAIAPDPDGAGPHVRKAVRNTYDTKGRVTLSEVGTVTDLTNAAWSAFSTQQQAAVTFDGIDRPLSQTVTAGGTTYGVTQFGYDHQRLDTVTTRLTSGSWGTLAGAGGTDRVTKYGYDEADRPTKVTSAYGTTDQSDDATVTYTPNGQQQTAIDANSNVTSYSYDGLDRLLTTTYPGGSSEQLGYDANGNVTSRVLRDGTAVGYSYDALNRVSVKTPPSGELAVSYSYDLLGHPTSITRPDGHYVNMTWDALGRQTSESTVIGGTVGYQYDAAGRRTQLTWNDGFHANYGYDNAGNMTAITDSGGITLATFGYDDLGRRTSLSRGNGVTTSYSYDGISNLASQSMSFPNPASNLSLTFGYNPAGQISSSSRSNDYYAWTGSVDVDRSYGVNGLNQYTSAGGTSFGYDARGNLTTSGASTYAYNSENMMTSASGGVGLTYDPVGRLLQATSSSLPGTRFGYDGSHLVAEYDTSNVLQKRYVFGPGADEALVEYDASANRTWLVADERGSIVARTDASGTATGFNRYDEYGIPQSTNAGRFQYTGQAWLPELGMYNYKARIYSPTLGRFMQTDPIGYGDGMNWYNYTHSDPVNGIDPTGLYSPPPPLPPGSGTDIIVTGSSGYCSSGSTLTNQGCITYEQLYQQQRSGARNNNGNGNYGGNGSPAAAPSTPPRAVVDKSCANVPAASDPGVQAKALDAANLASTEQQRNPDGPPFREYGFTGRSNFFPSIFGNGYVTGDIQRGYQGNVSLDLGWFDTFAVHTHSGATGPSPRDVRNTPSGFTNIVIGRDKVLRCYTGK